jgi:membrane protein implicated in regulation of membrane protease activity
VAGRREAGGNGASRASTSRGGSRSTLGVVHPFAKYLLVEVPEWVLAALIAVLLHRWLGLSPVAAALLLALWIGKDLFLYRSVRDAYVARGKSPREELLGQTGVVVKPLRPMGVVRIGGELWRAESASPGVGIPRGRRVRIEGVRGLVLTVAEERLPREARPQASTASSPGETSASGTEASPGGSAR